MKWFTKIFKYEENEILRGIKYQGGVISFLILIIFFLITQLLLLSFMLFTIIIKLLQ